jgi:hypothetical protein
MKALFQRSNQPSVQLSKLDYWVYALSLALCFLLFKQSDLTHTNSSSFAYLYGHFWDFWEYNQSRMAHNNYLPIFYWIFALWNLPLKLLGLIPEVTSVSWMLPTPIQTIWSKLLLVIFFFASVRALKDIADQIHKSAPKGKIGQPVLRPDLLYASSPIAIFSVFIFSGYDIFGLFFILLGVRSYFAKDFKWFAFWFSVAISFKYFAAICYLPLVLIIEKRVWAVMAFGIAGLFISAIQFALYWHSDVFIGQIFHLVGTKTSDSGHYTRFLIANSVYGAMCAYLYFSKDIQGNLLAWYERSIMVCLLANALFFSLVGWHPQWIILITPFICLAYVFIRSQRLLLWVEILGYLGFVIFTMNNWAGNVDNTMLYGGALASWWPETQTMASDVMGRRWLGFSRTAFYAMLYMPILIWVVERFKYKNTSLVKTNEVDDLDHFSKSSGDSNSVFTYLVAIRFLVGSYFLVIISAICFVRG